MSGVLRQTTFSQLGVTCNVGEHPKATWVPSLDTLNHPEAVGLVAGLAPIGIDTPSIWRVPLAGMVEERVVSPPWPSLRCMPVGLGPVILREPDIVMLLTVRLLEASTP